MHTNEYFSQLKTLEKDNIHPEFHTYVTTWVKSRQPEIYLDLMNNFRDIEGEIYAQHQCNGALQKDPF